MILNLYKYISRELYKALCKRGVRRYEWRSFSVLWKTGYERQNAQHVGIIMWRKVSDSLIL